MTSTLCTCTWLLLPCCVLVTLSTGELDFYRDEVRETSDNVVLRQLIKYLEGQRALFLEDQAYKKHLSDLRRKKQRDLLATLTSKGSLANVLKKGLPEEGWNYRQMDYNNEPINEPPPQRGRYYPFYELNPFQSPLEHPNFKLPYFPRDENEEEANYPDEDFVYDRKPSLKHLSYEQESFDGGMKEEPFSEYREQYRVPVNDDVFTFKFDNSNLQERHPFAVKPNDPRYYQDAPFFSDDEDKSDLEKPMMKNSTTWEQGNTIMNKLSTVFKEKPSDMDSKYEDTSVIIVPGLNQDLNNDIYFIAVVAGCSAAAMFALVLIALTWCRLKRGAKAAADIEYPAYGVTGPNKEVSPSGDQRLAQSAQMYHFQHQKQQIIAMEKDPGSVSEAESEEENEEGDYTVYECPGLASTGEMEVKNPLFHDDPTPATPAQMNKQEDHK